MYCDVVNRRVFDLSRSTCVSRTIVTLNFASYGDVSSKTDMSSIVQKSVRTCFPPSPTHRVSLSDSSFLWRLPWRADTHCLRVTTFWFDTADHERIDMERPYRGKTVEINLCSVILYDVNKDPFLTVNRTVIENLRYSFVGTVRHRRACRRHELSCFQHVIDVSDLVLSWRATPEHSRAYEQRSTHVVNCELLGHSTSVVSLTSPSEPDSVVFGIDFDTMMTVTSDTGSSTRDHVICLTTRARNDTKTNVSVSYS